MDTRQPRHVDKCSRVAGEIDNPKSTGAFYLAL